MGIDGGLFDTALEAKKDERGAKHDPELSAAHLRELVETFKAIVREDTGREFPTDP